MKIQTAGAIAQVSRPSMAEHVADSEPKLLGFFPSTPFTACALRPARPSSGDRVAPKVLTELLQEVTQEELESAAGG